MHTLYVENVPQATYDAIRERARRHRRLSPRAEIAVGPARRARSVPLDGGNGARDAAPVTAYVVDACVAAKWLLSASGEPLAAEAAVLLEGITAGRFAGLVPDFFWIELAQVLWKSAERGRIAPQAAPRALATARAFGLETLPALPHLESALALSLAFRLPVHDCLYAAMARTAGAEPVTADKELVRAMGDRLPVRWLGGL